MFTSRLYDLVFKVSRLLFREKSYYKLQIPKYKKQINYKFLILKFQTGFEHWIIVIWSLIAIWDLLFVFYIQL